MTDTVENFEDFVLATPADFSQDELFDIRVAEVIGEVDQELYAACAKFPPFNSAHEGFAVLMEEVDELWDEVRAKQGARSVADMRAEACQVAAMAMRFMMDVCNEERGQV